MKQLAWAVFSSMAVAACAATLPAGYHYEAGSVVPTINASDGLEWCRPAGIDHRVTPEECNAAISLLQNSSSVEVGHSMQQICITQGSAYRQAAALRDRGNSPQTALTVMRSYEQSGMSGDSVKAIINRVYFDGRYTNAGGPELANQIADECLYPEGKFKPLR